MRLFASLLFAFAVIGLSGPSVASVTPECTMTDMTGDMDGDQHDKGCCTPECAMACPVAAILLDDTGAAASYSTIGMIAAMATKSLGSIEADSADPPPRPLHS